MHIALESMKDFLRDETMKMSANSSNSSRGLRLLREQMSAVDAAIEASEEQANVLNNRLDMGRLMKGQYILKEEPIEANFLCKSLLNSNKVAINPGVKLVVETAAGGDNDAAMWIGVDTFLLTRALVNLFSNSRKNTYEGSVLVKVGLADVRGGGGGGRGEGHRNTPGEGGNGNGNGNGNGKGTANLVVSVTDTGVGIQEDRWPGIFEDGEKKFRDLRGTGLGLPFVRVIVKTMGGSVRLVSSVISVGTVFELVVPVSVLRGRDILGGMVDNVESSESDVGQWASLPGAFSDSDKGDAMFSFGEPSARQADGADGGCETEMEASPPRRISVLVVDDQPTLRKMIRHRLEALGDGENVEWILDDCRIGEEAIKKVEHGNKYDVITLDENMEREGGVLKGHEAMRKLRLLGFSGLIVSISGDVGETGGTDEDWAAAMKDHGADLVWGKPLPKKKAMWRALNGALLLNKVDNKVEA